MTNEKAEQSLVPVPAEGALPARALTPIMSFEEAKTLRQRIREFEEGFLQDSDFTWYATYKDGPYKRREWCDNRAQAEAAATRMSGLVERSKNVSAYESLGTYFNISLDPAPDYRQEGWCQMHGGAHTVWAATVTVIAPTGRRISAIARVATCERLTPEEQRLLDLASDKRGERAKGETTAVRRSEHDAPVMAIRRAYRSAMRTLIGFGEAPPYSPGAPKLAIGQEAPPPKLAIQHVKNLVKDAMAKADVVDEENGTATWGGLWALAKELHLTREQVHAHFGVQPVQGALLTHAKARAIREHKPLQQVVEEMRDELKVIRPGAAFTEIMPTLIRTIPPEHEEPR